VTARKIRLQFFIILKYCTRDSKNLKTRNKLFTFFYALGFKVEDFYVLEVFLLSYSFISVKKSVCFDAFFLSYIDTNDFKITVAVFYGSFDSSFFSFFKSQIVIIILLYTTDTFYLYTYGALPRADKVYLPDSSSRS